MLPHHSILKYIWTSPNRKTNNQIGHILIRQVKAFAGLDAQSFWADHNLVVARVRERLALHKQKSH
jgi:hypothetical protein